MEGPVCGVAIGQGHLPASDVASQKLQRANLIDSYVNGTLHLVPHNLPEPQMRSRRFVVSGPWIALQTAVIATDCAFTLTMPEKDPGCWMCHPARACLTTIVPILYCTDIAIRIYAFGCTVFFSKPWNILDVFIVFVTTCTAIFQAIGIPVFGIQKAGFLKIIRILRVVLMLRIVAGARRTSFAFCDCMRRVTGENKRRFISAWHDFDLDLTYITPRLIGMSVPAVGWLTPLYRNPLREVVRLFERFHPEMYFIVNLCPELPYPSSAFKTGCVEHFNVQDHMPPLFEHFIRFVHLAQKWLSISSEHVLAVHCRGGKGRTGSFCCAWLLYSGEAVDSSDALNFFAIRRTDLQQNRRKARVQGVETPSQVRYVEYFDKLLSQQAAYAPLFPCPPRRVRIRLHSLTAEKFFRRQPGSQLVVAVHDVSKQQVIYWSSEARGSWTWDLGATEVQGDTRISIFGRGNLLPGVDIAAARQAEMDDATAKGKMCLAGKEPGCMFYCVFHTSFLEGSELRIPMCMVDKACKKPKLYDEAGLLVLSFSNLWSASLKDME